MSNLNWPNKPRKAAVLVCVLVVLLLVGLLSAQSIQTLLIVRRSDAQRSEIRQARELVKLGRLAIAAGNIPELGQFDLVLQEHKATVAITEIGPAQTATNDSPALEGNEGTEGKASTRYRVVATYSVSESKEVTATWETPE